MKLLSGQILEPEYENVLSNKEIEQVIYEFSYQMRKF